MCQDTHNSVIDYITAPVSGDFTRHRINNSHQLTTGKHSSHPLAKLPISACELSGCDLTLPPDCRRRVDRHSERHLLSSISGEKETILFPFSPVFIHPPQTNKLFLRNIHTQERKETLRSLTYTSLCFLIVLCSFPDDSLNEPPVGSVRRPRWLPFCLHFSRSGCSGMLFQGWSWSTPRPWTWIVWASAGDRGVRWNYGILD